MFAHICIYMSRCKQMRLLWITRHDIFSTGLAFDRHWMVVNEDTGHFYSQRKASLLTSLYTPKLFSTFYDTSRCAGVAAMNAFEWNSKTKGIPLLQLWQCPSFVWIPAAQLPRMALIQPELPEAVLRAKPSTGLNPGQFMTLSAPGQPKLQVPYFCYIKKMP
jgi:hypothetical protein